MNVFDKQVNGQLYRMNLCQIIKYTDFNFKMIYDFDFNTKRIKINNDKNLITTIINRISKRQQTNNVTNYTWMLGLEQLRGQTVSSSASSSPS